MTIRTKSWQVSRISTDSKAKNRRPCLYCERNKHNRLAIGIKNPTQPLVTGREILFVIVNQIVDSTFAITQFLHGFFDA